MNRADRRRMQREVENGRTIKGWVEHPSPKQLKKFGSGWFTEMNKVYRQGDEYVVMTRAVDTVWGSVTHACMRNQAGTDIPWAEKQRIKNELFGIESQAIEVFPKESQLVDAANMYHFWVLPKEMKLPFTLKE
ncbi:hypothetical protein ACJ2A9_21430 [Anaerobacillus sp. MEB173]|uniref:DUF7694 domain-containing protein n=1 Tax=Anaerobacillus sp. MEB173 TaxID=3383345 RepID=UPI003F90D89C